MFEPIAPRARRECAATTRVGRTISLVVDAASHIGTLRETPLHASLKRLAARPGDRLEASVGGYVIDVVRDDLLLEIQTSGFSSMKEKATALLGAGYRLRIVHPIAVDKWIVKLDGDGEVISRRRSPKHGVPSDLFGELVSFPDLVEHAGLEIEVLMTIEEEHRRHVPGKAWRRNGWVVSDRRLEEVVDSILIEGPEDLPRLIPTGLEGTFTTADLATAVGRPRRAGQQMAYCLRAAGVIVAVGKRGNAYEYRLAPDTSGGRGTVEP